jgi:hypothetical protein
MKNSSDIPACAQCLNQLRDNRMNPEGWREGGSEYGAVRETTGLLLARATVLILCTFRKHQPFQVACNKLAHCANVFRMGSSVHVIRQLNIARARLHLVC